MFTPFATVALLRCQEPYRDCTHRLPVQPRRRFLHFRNFQQPELSSLIIDAEAAGDVRCQLPKSPRWKRPSQVVYLACVFSACSACVSHLSAISIKKDRCSEVRAASANRMHSVALLRTWTNVSRRGSILHIWGLTEVFARRMILDPEHSLSVSHNPCPSIGLR
jgi:hypothetical protein